MIERLVKSVLGIILSLALAFGGWLLTNYLIEVNARPFFAPRTVTRVAIPVHGDVEDSVIRHSLSPSEVFSVFQSWNPGNPQVFHEPAIDQIGLEEAVIIGRQNLSVLENILYLPEGFLESTHINIYIAQRGLPESTPWNQWRNELRDSIYSYWQLQFSSDTFSVVMKLNAFTGEMWSTSLFVIDRMYMLYLNEEEMVSMLEKLTALLIEQSGIEGGELNMSIMENMAEAWIAPRENMPGTTITIYGTELENEPGIWSIRAIQFSLLTESYEVDSESIDDNFTTYEHLSDE